ncbi:hypothetical protein [Isoptericola rhizosphaerae]|uniref:hypothetical protein n=1 Tax=Isoptericola rhizosphaerae TaxID=3377837 RepID=UPI00383AC2BC
MVDAPISTATLNDAVAIALYLGDDAVARWLDRLITHPEWLEVRIEEQLQNHGRFMALGSFVRRLPTVHGPDDAYEGPGPWHVSSCRFVARAGVLTNWEGVEELPNDGRLCSECRAGQPAPAAQLPPTQQDRARDEIRDQIALLGTFVRRRGEDGAVPIPPGKWHRAGCRTTRTAADARAWEGVAELPSGEGICKTCLRNG